jgi:hypothetical protein
MHRSLDVEGLVGQQLLRSPVLVLEGQEPFRFLGRFPAATTTAQRCPARRQGSFASLISRACSIAGRSFAAFSIAFASRSFSTISSGLCFFRRLGVIESLLARKGFDLHTAWIRFSNAGQHR